LQTITIEEVEQRERVFDPMGAVPDLPFGHLNAAWQKFRDGLEPQDVIWTFSAHLQIKWQGEETITGYLAVCNNRIDPSFSYYHKIDDDD
jgi:hypothetical protein